MCPLCHWNVQCLCSSLWAWLRICKFLFWHLGKSFCGSVGAVTSPLASLQTTNAALICACTHSRALLCSWIWVWTPGGDSQDGGGKWSGFGAALSSWCLWGCFGVSLGGWIPYPCESEPWDLRDGAGLSWCFSSLPRAAQTWGSKAQVTSVQGLSDNHKHESNNFGGNSRNDALKIHEYRWLQSKEITAACSYDS